MADFKLRYSPLFYDDLDKITDYLLTELKDGPAAKKLVYDTEVAIRRRLSNPLGTTIYKSISAREHSYRRIIVNNYLIFYVTIDDTMIVRRMLYGRADIDRIL